MDAIAISGLEPKTIGMGPINNTPPMPASGLAISVEEMSTNSIPAAISSGPIFRLMQFANSHHKL